MKRFYVSVFLCFVMVFSIFPLGIVPSGATAEGVEGFLHNPASLGFNSYNAVSIDLSYIDAQNYTTSLFLGNNLGMIYTLTGASPSYTFFIGMGYPIIDNLYLGYDISIGYVSDTWGVPVYDFGVLGVPFNALSIGIYQRNMVGDGSLNFSVGLRPLYLFSPSLGTRLTLFADVGFPFSYSDIQGVNFEFFTHCIDNLSYSVGFKTEPLDGLSLGMGLDNENRFDAGVEMSSGDTDFYFSLNSGFDFSDYRFSMGMKLNKNPKKTIFKPPIRDYMVKFSHSFDPSSVDKSSLYNIDSFVAKVYELANDSECNNLYVVFDHPVVGSIGELEKIKDAYFYFKSKGKKIVAYVNNSFSQLDYLAAACGSEVIIPPSSFIFLSGVGAEFLFFKNLFDREGIEVEYARSSNYKSALDAFIRENLSKENREQYTAYLRTIYQLFKDILKGRGFDDRGAIRVIDNGPYNAKTAKREGLVDGLMYYDDFERKYFKEQLPTKMKVVEYAKKDWKEKPVIAVFKLSGSVINSAGLSPINYLFGGSYITEKNTIPFIKMAEKDDRIKALIVQINSPGGDGVISDEIWNALVKLKEKKPVVVVMDSVAASGGYYIAMAGDYIVANRSTLTGSIGAFSYKYVIKKLLKRYGITTDSIKFGKNYNLFSPFSELTEEQRKKVEGMTDFFVKDFYMKVAKARGLSVKRVEEIGGGRIYSGEDALKLKLVDKIGGLRDAIDYLKKRLNLPKDGYIVEYYPDEGALFKMFIEEMEDSDISAKNVLGNLMMETLFLRPFLER